MAALTVTSDEATLAETAKAEAKQILEEGASNGVTQVVNPIMAVGEFDGVPENPPPGYSPKMPDLVKGLALAVLRRVEASSGGGGSGEPQTAAETPYTPPPGGLTSGNVEAALNEVEGRLDGVEGEVDGIDSRVSTLESASSPAAQVDITQVLMTSGDKLNLTLDGSRDWFCLAGTTTVPRLAGLGNLHTKDAGEQMFLSFDWIAGSQFTQAGWLDLEYADGTFGAVTLGIASDQGVWTNTEVGFGYRLRVPADTFTRRLRIYGSVYSGAVTVSVIFPDTNTVFADDTVDPGAAAFQAFHWEINYNAARDGQQMIVVVKLTENHGSSPNIKFAAATLS